MQLFSYSRHIVLCIVVIMIIKPLYHFFWITKKSSLNWCILRDNHSFPSNSSPEFKGNTVIGLASRISCLTSKVIRWLWEHCKNKYISWIRNFENKAIHRLGIHCAYIMCINIHMDKCMNVNVCILSMYECMHLQVSLACETMSWRVALQILWDKLCVY